MSSPKATLYHFRGSCWAAVPRLVAIEKGFSSEQLELKEVNLLEGQNFSPAYLKISPRGTVPALVIPYEETLDESVTTKYKSLADSITASDALDNFTLANAAGPRLSPATIQGAQDAKLIIETVHSQDAPDPNFLLLSFRDDKERQTKLNGVPGKFLQGRQDALVRYQKEAGDDDARLAVFLEKKVEENGALLALYQGKGDSTEFTTKSKAAWANLAKTLAFLESQLSADATSTFLGGNQVSLADLHAAAWLARVASVAGATELDGAKAAAAIDKEIGKAATGPKVAAWLDALFERASFKEVYAEGLH